MRLLMRFMTAESTLVMKKGFSRDAWLSLNINDLARRFITSIMKKGVKYEGNYFWELLLTAV